MSLGTITIESVKLRKDGGQVIRMSFAGDDSYPTGGTATFSALVKTAVATAHAAAGDANVRGYESLAIQGVIPQDCGQYVPSYDKANDKLFVRDGGSATWAEVGSGVSLAGTTFNVLALCF